MARENSGIGKDLERITKRLQAGKKSLHRTELKAEDLDASIQTAIRNRELRKKHQKDSR